MHVSPPKIAVLWDGTAAREDVGSLWRAQVTPPCLRQRGTAAQGCLARAL